MFMNDKTLHLILSWYSLLSICQHSPLMFCLWTFMMSRNCRNFSLESAFVNISAIWFWVLQYLISITPIFSTASRIKLYFTLICFVRLWNTGFFAMNIADLLSQNRVVEPLWFCSMSSKIFLNQRTWDVAKLAATYQLLLKKELQYLFFVNHETKPEPREKI